MRVLKVIDNLSGSKLFALLTLVYIFMWAGGMASYLLLGEPPTRQAWASPLFLFLAGLLVFLSTHRSDWWKLAAIALIGLSAEAVGVQSGLLFSPYRYTPLLQPQLLGVPLVMACAWFVLVSYIRQMLQPLGLSAWLDVLISSLWMTAIDLIIDPLAANQLGYWRWEEGGVYYGIPLHNFAGWFITSLVIFIVVRKAWRPGVVAKRVGLSIVIFFTVIALAFKLMLACAIGAGLIAVHLVTARYSNNEQLLTGDPEAAFRETGLRYASAGERPRHPSG